MTKTIRGGLMWAPCWKGATEGRDKVVCFFSFLNKQNVNMYSNCKNVNMYYKKRWPMLLKWGLFSRLPGLIIFRAIKTGICSPGWRQNNSNKTKWPMSSRLNNLLCVRQHIWTLEMSSKIVFQGLARWLARSQTPRPLQTPCGRVTT